MGGHRTILGRSVLAALLLAGTVGPGAPAASAQVAPPVTELCAVGVSDIPGLGDGACVALESAAVLFAAVCAEALPAEVCANLDGRVVDSSQVDEYQDTWVHQALRLQSRYDDDEPMRNWLVPHTHNSSNTTADPVSVANLDPNQRYSITDQLRMDIRGIELDLHLVGGTPVLCHGRSTEVGPVILHVGCSIDRPLTDGLDEIAAFLAAPGNEDAFVVLYLENQLDGDPAVHDEVAGLIEASLGDLVQRPPSGTGDGVCADAPMDTTRRAMRARGHRVVIVGDCGPGAWGSWVFERGPTWRESSYTGSPIRFPDCATGVRVERDYDANWIRHWEDLTALSALVAGGAQLPITPEVTAQMVECGVDMIGFDRLEPFDGRLEALVWSWAPGELPTGAAGSCAARHVDDGRWHMDDCGEPRTFSCRTDGGEWLADVPAGPWSEGEQTCAELGATWALPSTGWQDNVLGAAAAGDAWLPIGTVAAAATGGATDPAIGAAIGGVDGAPTGSLPATGSGLDLAAVAASLAGLAALVAWRSRRAGRRL